MTGGNASSEADHHPADCVVTDDSAAYLLPLVTGGKSITPA